MSNIHGLGPKLRLGKVLFDFYSKRYALYEVKGIQEPDYERQADDYDERGAGTDGVVLQEQIYNNYTFSADIRTWRPFSNSIDAILQDRNPGYGDSQSAGDPLILVGGSLSMAKKLQIMAHLLSEDRTKVVGGLMAFDVSKIAFGAKATFTAEVNVPFAGEATRVYSANKYPYVDVFQHNVSVSQQATPDDTCEVGNGSVALRRETMTDIRPILKPLKKQTSATFNVVTSDSRIDALVAYETGNGYNDVALTIVEGTETASPTPPADADIETAVDALNSGARWCRLANITVDETTGVLVEAADIEIPSASTFTLTKTALALNDVDEAYTEDSFIMHSHVMACAINGELKDNLIGIDTATCNETTFAFQSPQSGLIALFYWTDVASYQSA